MAYSNGFNSSVILPVLRDRIGWRSEGKVRSFESFHALCTEQNLRDFQPQTGINDTDWDILKATIKDDVILRCLSSVFSQPEYIEQVLLHNRLPLTPNTAVANNSQFCGLRFKVAADWSKCVIVNSITLLFDQSKTFNLYLYKDGDPNPLSTISVTSIANKPTVISLAAMEPLSYAKQGATTFFLGYFQDDLGTAKAIREQVCNTPTKAFAAISFAASGTGGVFNPLQISYAYDTYGLNAEVQSFIDYTYKIQSQAHLLDEAIGLQMVYYVIEQLLNTTRSNTTERKLGDNQRLELYHYLNGALPAMGVAKTKGLNELLQEKYDEVRQSFYPRPKAQTVSLCS